MDKFEESLKNDSTYDFLRSLSLPADPSDSEDYPKKRTKTDSGNWYPIGRITPSTDYVDLQKSEKLLTSQKKGDATKSLNVTSSQDSKKTDTQHLNQSSYEASTARYIVGSGKGFRSDSPEASDLSIVHSNSDKSINAESKLKCHIYKEWKLSPPCDGNVPLPKVERPLGCKTVAVYGLPSKMHKTVVNNIFHKFGQIQKLQIKEGFVEITFKKELAVDKALKFNGYQVSNRFDWKSKSSVICIDFVPVWEEQQEYIRKMEVNKVKEEKEQLLQTKTSKKRSSSPMPLNTEFSNHAMIKLMDELRDNTTANHNTDLLVRWMVEGKCNQGNCQNFYDALMILQAYLPRVLVEREKLREVVQLTQNNLKEKYSLNSLFFAEILKAYNVATSETVLNKFAPEMKTKLETGKAYIEAAIESNNQDMMKAHSTSWDKVIADKMKRNLPASSTSEMSLSEEQMSEIRNLQVENDRLKKELKIAQQETSANITRLISQRSDKLKGGNQQAKNIKKDNPDDKSTKITEREARLIALIGPFLNFHRYGESTENICRHLAKIDNAVTNENLEGLMRKLPKVFKEETIDWDDNSETKWTLLGI